MTQTRLVTDDMLARLPAPVQRYLHYAGVVGKPWIETVRLTYEGRFRTAPDKPWMPITATQFYTTTPPRFLWKARFKMAGLPLMNASDTFKDGHGHMHGKLIGLFTVVDGRGDEVDQGTMVRYLQEMTWFPAAYLSDYITWSGVDDHCADVTLSAYGKQVAAHVYFDDAGRMLSFVARRYGEFNGTFVVKPWSTPTTQYGQFDGVRVPVAGQGVWQLEDGDFAYIDVRLNSLAYNVPIPTF
ncbi:MAG: hypothetical protein IT320_21715 [Anaerolineae bacterium]|nr:hypothetical protein [Anaerolineae bacterium]